MAKRPGSDSNDRKSSKRGRVDLQSKLRVDDGTIYRVDYGKKIITITTSKEETIELAELFRHLQALFMMANSGAYIFEFRPGPIPMTDGTEFSAVLILKDGWRLGGEATIVGGGVAGVNQDGQHYDPIASEGIDFELPDGSHWDGSGWDAAAWAQDGGARDDSGRVVERQVRDEIELESGGRAAQTVPPISQRGGDVNVEPGAAQLQLEGFAPSVKVGPGAIPVSQVAREHGASKDQLAKLLEALGGFHGYDAPGQHNSVEIPLSQDQLATVRAAVTSALAAHEAPTVTHSLLNALDNLGQIIKKFGEVMVQAAKSAEETGKAWTKAVQAYEGLALKAGAAYLAIKELIDIAMPLLGG